MNYRNLEVWQLARALVVTVHRMTLIKLPKFEMYEERSQIRRSIKSVKSNIVEGSGRRRYKQEFVSFIGFALASCDATADHLDTLIVTKSLTDGVIIDELSAKLEELGRKRNLFLQSAQRSHRSQQ
jgi:four helix bundle protein